MKKVMKKSLLTSLILGLGVLSVTTGSYAN